MSAAPEPVFGDNVRIKSAPDHAPGMEIRLAGARFKSVRTEDGGWVDVPLTGEDTDLPAHRMRRHRRMTVLSIVLFALLILVWLLPASIWLRESLAVDRCLDSGGSFDYAEMRCDPDTTHSYVPFRERHPQLVAAIPILAVGTALAIIAYVVTLLRERRGAGQGVSSNNGGEHPTR